MQEEPRYWFVTANWAGRDPADQTPRFLREGIWENDWDERFDRFLDRVRQVRPGDRIAIQEYGPNVPAENSPFRTTGKFVTSLFIKATGTVVSNHGDGRRVEVRWNPAFTEPRQWFGYTKKHPIWLPQKGKWKDMIAALIGFAFDGEPQSNGLMEKYWLAPEQRVKKSPKSPADATMTPSEPSDEPSLEVNAYGVDDIVEAGIFIPKDDLEQILRRWRSKRNIVLQGAPGVGKTFLARHLAYALMEEREPERINVVQFHQSYSYDDFVRGYRPKPGGGFEIKDGVFYGFCEQARADQNPDHKWVFIIDEMNRGNLAQIFGELLMLIEDDKRRAEYGVPLVYRHSETERFHVPENVYLIGLMNTADRSLAIIDYALRRRFAFITIEPQYASAAFLNWLTQRGMSQPLIDLITRRMTALNDNIAEDGLLGESYRIGHSFFCPKGDDFRDLDRSWYDDVVETEVLPLLQEYWFDNPGKVAAAHEALRAP
jgi:5-methylcytosine-specific restriction protein B